MALNSVAVYNETIEGLVIRCSWMKCLFGSMAFNITCGGPLIRTEVVDIFLQERRNATTARRFFKRLIRNHGGEPRKIVTDKLGSYRVAHREMIPDTIHETAQYANNLSELSHQSTRVRERVMRRLKSTSLAQRFLESHAAGYNLFNLQRHCVRAEHYRRLRISAFAEWNKAVT